MKRLLYAKYIAFVMSVMSTFSTKSQAQQLIADIIPASYNVSPTGAFTYTVPLRLPPGIGEVMPGLAVSYNSQGGNGLLGIGWSISGLSSITRGTKTLFHNEKVEPVDFTDDAYYLDGQRLFPTGAGATTYYTEVKNFAIIESFSNGTTGNGPSYFSVKHPNGLIYEYGNSNSSKLLATGRPDVLMWALNRITDQYGNYIEFNYHNDNTIGDYRIANIYYTGNINTGTPTSTEIKFEYITRTDKNKAWISGSEVRTDVVLDYIQVEHNATFVKKYKFDYDLNMYTHLVRIKEILPNNMEMPAIDVSWASTSNGPTDVPTSLGSNSQTYDYTVGDFNGDGATDIAKYLTSSSPFTYGSLHISDKNDNFTTLPSDAIQHPNSYTIKYAKKYYNGIGSYYFDYDGDGDDDMLATSPDVPIPSNVRMDFMLFKFDKSQNKMVYDALIMRYAPLGGTSTAWVDKALVVPGDYDGDGKTEILFGYPHIQTQTGMILSYDLYLLGEEYPAVPIGNDLIPHIFYANVGSITNGQYNAFAMDMDGDGKDEFVRAPSNSLTTLEVYKIDIAYNPSPSSGPKFRTTSPGNSLIQVYTNSFPNNYHYIYPGDFNGDGNSDMLVFALPNNNPGPQNGDWRIEYSKGNSFDVQNLPSNVSLEVQGPSFPAWQTYYINDFNGDGKTDILQLHQNSTSTDYDLYYSLGDNQFEHEGQQLSNIHHDDVFTGDFNGDGQMDLLCHYGTVNATPRIYYFNKNANNHTVTSITHADHTIDIETEYLTHDTEYEETNNTIGGTLGYPYIERQIPIRVVKRVSDNVGNEQTYKYSNYIFNQLGLGMRGMMYTWTTDVPKSKMIANEYNLLGAIRVPYLSKSALWDLNTFNDVQNSTLPPFPATKPITLTETLMENVDGGLSGKVIIPFSQDVHSYDFSNGTYSHTTLNGQNLNTGPGTAIYEFGLVPYIVTYSYYNQALNSGSTEHYTYDMNAPFYSRAKPIRRQTVTSYNNTNYSRITDFTYDTQGSLTRVVTDPGTNNRMITDYTYDPYGNIASETKHPFGATFPTLIGSYTYTPDGRFRETATNATSFTLHNQYDNVWGNLMQGMDMNGLLTTYQYDANNRVTEVTTPTGAQTLYFYDWAVNSFFNPTYTLNHERPRFLVTEQIVGMGGSTLKFTDFYGRDIRKVSVAFDGSILYQDDKYNVKGQLIESKEPYGTLNANPVITTYTYDAMDRLTSTSMSNNGPSSTIAYTPVMPDMPPHGIETTVTTSAGVVKTTKTNAMGQVLRVEEGINTIDYNYHANGQYLDITVNGNSQLVTQYVYDAYGRPTTITEPNAGPTTYAYDPYGRVISKTDANNTTHGYAYDPLGRLTQKHDVNNNIYYYYNYNNPPGMNTAGKLISTTSTTLGQTYDTYDYDQFGRMIRHNDSYYEYDMYNRLSKYTFHGDSYNNIYNQFGFLEQVTSDQEVCTPPAGPCANYIQTLWKANAVNHRGQVTEAEYYNFQNTPIYTINKAYDAFGYLTNHTVTNNISTNVIYNYQYSFDTDNGNLDSRTDVLRSLTENFTYDPKERLTQVAYSNSLPVLQMTYDDNGNILKKSDVSASVYDWKYNAYALERVPEPQTSNPAYAIPVNKQNVSYTPFRKAKTISEEVNRIDITYNPVSEQRTKTEWFDINGNPSGTLLKTKMYNDGGEIFIDAVNNPNQCAVWSNYVPAYGDNIAIIERKTYSQSPFHILDDTAIRFTITDHLGSLVMILDNEGLVNDGVLEERTFDAWGRTRDINTWQPDPVMLNGIQFNPGWMVDRGYTFHEHYWENGIINMNGRLYDPVVGRMFSPDPANMDNTNTESYNKYAYVMNNPLKYTDPSGNEPVTAAIIIAAAVVGAATNVAFNYNNIGSFADGLGYAMIGAYAGVAGCLAGAGIAAAVGVGSAMGAGAIAGAAGGAAGGFITEAGNAYIGYASATQGLKAGLISAGIGGASGAVTGAIVGGLRSVIGKSNNIVDQSKKIEDPVGDHYKTASDQVDGVDRIGLDIEIGKKDFGYKYNQFNWVQTVDSDHPLNRAAYPKIDCDLGVVDYPLYNSADMMDHYISKGFATAFKDHPRRPLIPNSYFWKAELSLLGRDTRVTTQWTRIKTWSWGWTSNGGTHIQKLPLNVVRTPSQFHLDAIKLVK